jgi:FimV-like protein
MVRLVEALAALDQLARRQEVLTEKLLSRAPTMTLPEPRQPEIAYSLATDPAVRQLEREADPHHGKASWKRMPSRQSWIFIAAGGGAILLVLAAIALWPGPRLRGKIPVAPPAVAGVTNTNTSANPEKVVPSPGSKEPAAEAEPKDSGESDIPVVVAPTAPPKATGPAAEAERKVLRQDLMTAYKKKRWADAVRAGTKMRDSFAMDWEAEYTLARAQQAAGKMGDAAESFLAFALHFPTNKFVGEASLTAARILIQQGKKDQARPVLQRLSEEKDPTIQKKAKELLGQTGTK